MKLFSLALVLAAVAVAPAAHAAKYSKGYIKKNGTYVAPHFKTAPDKSRYNNFSTKGNTNPYTGKKGYKNPYKF